MPMPPAAVPAPVRRSVRLRLSVAATTALATAGAALTMVPATATADAGGPTTVQMSVWSGGFAPGNGSNGQGTGTPQRTERRLVSDDGRFVTFEAVGAMVPGQRDLDRQIVQRDRMRGTTTLVSRGSDGEKGNASSYHPSMSADGRWISFTSVATNLVAGDTNDQGDVFLHDTRTGSTTRVSVDDAGHPIENERGHAVWPSSISADGRWIAFHAETDEPLGRRRTSTSAFLHDRLTRTTEIVSVAADGLRSSVATGDSISVSADGSRVAFVSVDQDVAPGADNSDPDVFLRDRTAGTTRKIAGGEEGASYPTMSADGRFVAYQSTDPGIDPADTNTRPDVFVVDLTTMEHSLVSRSSTGVVGDRASRHPAISDDGRFVTFESDASDLVAGDTNGVTDVFRHDLRTGTTVRVSHDDDGRQSPTSSRAAAVSGDGQHVMFDSHATLSPAATQGWSQVYLRDLDGVWPALFAWSSALPRLARPGVKHDIRTRDIADDETLEVSWKPTGGTKGRTTSSTVRVRSDSYPLRARARAGSYTVTVTYGGQHLTRRELLVQAPGAKKLPSTVKRGKKVKVRTTGLKKGTAVHTTWRHLGSGKVAVRSDRTDKRGDATVRAPSKKGVYRVIVATVDGKLRTGKVRVR